MTYKRAGTLIADALVASLTTVTPVFSITPEVIGV